MLFFCRFLNHCSVDMSAAFLAYVNFTYGHAHVCSSHIPSPYSTKGHPDMSLVGCHSSSRLDFSGLISLSIFLYHQRNLASAIITPSDYCRVTDLPSLSHCQRHPYILPLNIHLNSALSHKSPSSAIISFVKSIKQSKFITRQANVLC